MSVINQMLRDLDRRTIPADRAIYASHTDRQSRSGIAKWCTVATLLMATGIGIGVAVKRWDNSADARHSLDMTAEKPGRLINGDPSIVVEPPAPDAAPDPNTAMRPIATALMPAEPIQIVVPKSLPPVAKPLEGSRPGESKVVKQQIAAPQFANDPLEKLITGIANDAGPHAPASAAPVSLATQPPVEAAHTPAPRIDKRALGDEATFTAEATFRRAALLIDQGRLIEAQERLREALNVDARHEPARQTLAALLLESKSYDAADAVLTAGLQRNPAQTNFALALSRLHLERGNMQGAINVLREHEQFAIGHAEYRAFTAALHGKSGAHAKVIAEYQAALRLAPRVGAWWVGLGIAYEAEERMDAATQAYRNARNRFTVG